ncbi:MAG: hypothetical protein IT161_23755 [Bryobacterales bacterium]|nr:hypothetical protein [Bryobacterales bacterium]
MTVLMLSETGHRIEVFRKCCLKRGLTLTLARTLREAQNTLRRTGRGVLVFDAGVWTWPEVHWLLGADLHGWSVLVVLPNFTSEEWMGAFKAGASEVISEPLTVAKVNAALDAVTGLASSVRLPAEPGKGIFGHLIDRMRSLL